MNKYWHGVAMTLIAAICWGIMSPIAKVLSGAGISMMSVMAFRALFVVVVMGPYLIPRAGISLTGICRFLLSPACFRWYFPEEGS